MVWTVLLLCGAVSFVGLGGLEETLIFKGTDWYAEAFTSLLFSTILGMRIMVGEFGVPKVGRP